MGANPCENVVVANEFLRDTDVTTLFGDEEVHVTNETDLPRLLVELGVYKSTTQARNAGRKGLVPDGFSDKFKGSKKRYLWIWNPTE